jgi:tetratricopeptide (TPR) repeat protein
MLELYFEHRNYLPVLGFVFFLIIAFERAAFCLGNKLLPYGLIAALFALNIFSVQQIAFVWGRPLVAAELWHKSHPDSTRSVQVLYNAYYALGEMDKAFNLLDSFSQDIALGRVEIVMQALGFACLHLDAAKQQELFNRVFASLPYMKKPLVVVVRLPMLGDIVREGGCEGVKQEDYDNLLEVLMRHPRVSNVSRAAHYVHYEIALNAKQQGNHSVYIEHAKKAYFAFPSLSIAQKVGAELFVANRYQEAIDWLDEAESYTPRGLVGNAWKNSMRSMRNAIIDVVTAIEKAEN